jgi:hypothetical protein
MNDKSVEKPIAIREKFKLNSGGARLWLGLKDSSWYVDKETASRQVRDLFI